MIRVHHLNESRSQRILWLFEELGLEYEVVGYRRNTRTYRAPAELRRLHPLGKAPIVEQDGEVLAETGAIIEAFVERHGPQLAPATAYRTYRYWMHYAEGSLMPQLLLKLVVDKLGPLGWPVRRMVREQVDLHLDFIEGEIGKRVWLTGDHFSAADIMMSFPLEIAMKRAGPGPSRPNIARLVAAMQARPAYQRAMARGGDALAAA